MSELFPTIHHVALDDDTLPDSIRAEWPAVIPEDAAGDAVQRAFVACAVRVLFGVTIDAIFTSETYGDGFAVDLSHVQRARNARAPVVRHVFVDLHRVTRPVSASMVRTAPHQHMDYLSPVVRADFIERVCLLGG